MSSASVPRFQQRLNQAAAAAHDLLRPSRVDRWEVFAKASSFRATRLEAGGGCITLGEETGVAVRSFRKGLAGFAAASGLEAGAARRAVEGALSGELPSDRDPLPPARLLGSVPVPAGDPPAPEEWPESVVAELESALTECAQDRVRLVAATAHQGQFAWVLTTAEGFVAGHTGTTCYLLVEAVAKDPEAGVWREWVHVRNPASFEPRRLAASLTDRMLLAGPGVDPTAGVQDLLLHREVAAHLLAAMAPLFLATPPENDHLPALLDRKGLLAAPMVSVVDDRIGRFGPLSGPCDGEGIPSESILVLDRGAPRHRIASFRDAMACGDPALGGAARHSYRDYPATGFTNLLLRCEEGEPPHHLLSEIDRAVYLVRPTAQVEIDLVSGTLRLVASGVSLDGGRIQGWHPVVEVRTGLGSFLRGIEMIGNDLQWFQARNGCVGAPSLLVRQQPVS